MAALAPPAASRREPEDDSSWEQGKLPGRLLSSHLGLQRMVLLKGAGALTSVAQLIGCHPAK